MRKMARMVLSLVLLAALVIPAQAASAGSFLFQSYDVIGEDVLCYGKQLAQGGTLTASYGSTKVEEAEFSTIRKENVPVTVYCLVDSATSLSHSIVQQEQDILQSISSLMTSGDTMVISSIDKTFREGKPLSGSSSRTAAIDGITRESWITNLYSGIDQSVDSVSTNTSYNTSRFLVILTDGHDDGKVDVKTDAVLEKIRAAHIPVYTVILGSGGQSGGTQKELDYLKQFSDESMGGYLCSLAGEKISAVKAAEKIWNSIQDSSVISIKTSALPQEDDVELLIRYDTTDTRYEDTILIRGVDLIEPSQPEEDTEEKYEDTEEDSGLSIRTEIIIAAVVVAVVILATVTFILLRKSHTAESSQEDGPAPEPVSEEPERLEHNPLPETRPVQSPIGPTEAVQDCHVFLIAIMHPEVKCDFWLAEKVERIVGRDPNGTVVLNSQDQKLSRKHAAFLWDGKHLLVRDNHSTRGTLVNGARCAGNVWYLVENGATLQAGGYEYRVTYTAGETK